MDMTELMFVFFYLMSLIDCFSNVYENLKRFITLIISLWMVLLILFFGDGFTWIWLNFFS